MIATVARKEFRGALRDGRVLAGACVLLLLGLVALASAGARYASLSSERAVAQALKKITSLICAGFGVGVSIARSGNPHTSPPSSVSRISPCSFRVTPCNSRSSFLNFIR